MAVADSIEYGVNQLISIFLLTLKGVTSSHENYPPTLQFLYGQALQCIAAYFKSLFWFYGSLLSLTPFPAVSGSCLKQTKAQINRMHLSFVFIDVIN